MSKNDEEKIPSTALILGLAGLIPFVSAALASLWLEPAWQEKSSFALGAYGAVILSFLGGVKWGVLLHNKTELQRWMPLVLSVLPSIVAWLALLLTPKPMLIILALALVAQYFLDTKSVQQNSLPAWYGRLRLVLTAGAVGSLLIGLLVS